MENLDNMTLNERLEIHKGECLAIHKPKYEFQNKKHIGSGKGTFVERDLFESPAYFALSGVAPQMLIYLLGKRIFKKPNKKSKTRTCENEDHLTFSYIELKKLGITQPRGTRGFDELLAKGFIKIKHHGGGYQKDQNIYALSNQWLLWRKGIVLDERPKGLKKGFQRRSQKTISTYETIAYKDDFNIRNRNQKTGIRATKA